MRPSNFDPITLEVIRARITSLADEAAKVIVRTSFSFLLNEANDYSCVLTDHEGNLLAQNTASLPNFVGTLPQTVRHFIKKIGPDNMAPGDVLITNNPWMGTGHLNDITLCKPIFVDDQLAAFAGTTGHVPDIGGQLRSAEPREVFEEGFHIPLMKLMRRGVADASLLTLLRCNVRTPNETIGDIFAHVGALEVMERRLLELMGEYKLSSLASFGKELFRRSEAAMRDAIRALRDGTYSAEMQTDGLEEPLTFKVAVRVTGDEIDVDYAGTSPQQSRAINAVFAYTVAETVYALKCALLPWMPNNEGMFRPISVRAPEGSIVNPRFPVSVGGRVCSGDYLPALVMTALYQIIPERVIACSGSPLWSMIISGIRDSGAPFSNLLFFNGGMGATASKDGANCLGWPNNVSAIPVEVTERDTPLFVHHKKLCPDTGGRGKFRGGLGEEMLFESESELPIAMVCLAERTRFPAAGLGGGGSGALGEVVLNGVAIDTRKLHMLRSGDKLSFRTPGGGGYGDSAERDVRLAARDAAQEYVTVSADALPPRQDCRQ